MGIMASSTDMRGKAATNDLAGVEELLAKGADVNSTNEFDNWTALHHAAQEGFVDMIKLLLSKGADPSIKDAKGRLPLDLAKDYGNKEAIALLEGRWLYSTASPPVITRAPSPQKSPSFFRKVNP